MTRTELAIGSAILIAVIAAGLPSAAWVDRHYATVKVDKTEVPGEPHDPQKPSASLAPCVGADGSWKNWVWANVPMLSPKCAPDR